MDFWTDLLIDFCRVFGRVLGTILTLKINEKSVKQLSKILIDFIMAFLAKMSPKWKARGTPKSIHFVHIS